MPARSPSISTVVSQLSSLSSGYRQLPCLNGAEELLKEMPTRCEAGCSLGTLGDHTAQHTPMAA